MSKPTTIIVGIDYAASADEALREAVRLAGADGRALVAVHVIATEKTTDSAALWGANEEIVEREKQRLSDHARAIVEGLPDGTEFRVVWGEPAAELTQLAEECRPSLLVVGRQGSVPRAAGDTSGTAAQLVVGASSPVLLCGAAVQSAKSDAARTSGGAATVADVMHTPAITVHQTDSLATTQQTMKRANIHQVAVVEDDRLIGIVSLHDVAQQAGYLEQTKVDAVMTSGPVIVTPETAIERAIALLIEEQINALPVIEDGKLIGMLSKTDLIRLVPQLMKR